MIEQVIVTMLHKITKPTSWRRDPQVLEDVFEDAKPIKGSRGEQEGAGRGMFAGASHGKPRKNRRGQEQDEALPPMRVDDLSRAARCQKVTSGLGTDVFRPKILLQLSNDGCAKLAGLEQRGHR